MQLEIVWRWYIAICFGHQMAAEFGHFLYIYVCAFITATGSSGYLNGIRKTSQFYGFFIVPLQNWKGVRATGRMKSVLFFCSVQSLFGPKMFCFSILLHHLKPPAIRVYSITTVPNSETCTILRTIWEGEAASYTPASATWRRYKNSTKRRKSIFWVLQKRKVAFLRNVDSGDGKENKEIYKEVV